MPTEILMPALSPTMEEGKLSKWLVKEGDIVKAGDIIAEIETDKAIMEFETVDEGLIKKILVTNGTEEIKINSPIAIIELDSEIDDSSVDLPVESNTNKNDIKNYPEQPTNSVVDPKNRILSKTEC